MLMAEKIAREQDCEASESTLKNLFEFILESDAAEYNNRSKAKTSWREVKKKLHQNMGK